jgi:hypothetical protein
MPTADNKDLHPPFPDDDALSSHDDEAVESPNTPDISEIAMRLSVLGKLIIPPTAPR